MIKVNDYIEVSFVRFIEKKGFNLDNEYTDRNIIEEYLYDNCTKWDIKFFLKLFQDFLISQGETNESIIKKFEVFVSDSFYLEFINPTSIDKQPRLQGFLNHFYRSLKDSENYQEMSDFLMDSAIKAYRQNTGIEEWFILVIEKYGSTLKEAFELFTTNTLYHHLYLDFQNWVDSTLKKQWFIPRVNERYDFSFEDRRSRLSYLIASPPVKIKFHPKMVTTDKEIRKDFEFQYIDFLQYLENRGVNLAKTITYPIMMQLIEDYCIEYDQPKAPLKKFAKSINKKDSLFKKFIGDVRKSPKGEPFSIERLGQTKAHGLILFPKHLNLSSFLQIYWDDIHHMTQDYLDIYYTEEDLKTNISGYKRLKNLSEIYNKFITLPALFVWEKFGTEVYPLELIGLEHKEVYQILEFFTAEISKGTAFVNAKENTNQQIIKLNERKKNMEKYNLTVNGNGPVNFGENPKIEINKIEYQTVNSQSIDKEQLMKELTLIEEGLQKLNNKNNDQKILLSDIIDTRKQAEEMTSEGIKKRLIDMGSTLLYNTATGVNAGIIANIISKAIGL
ncbi:hypothetical protein [Falsibacillus pallidus]|uniref:Uncharacterized protein n=1 Tax=Falsibacillus pallidus TaxID=493781 RepID=A0A370GCW9_9BACI|nr:hypothetical protein [Falsibacillus pallidus]RDI41665.1 hypothetical protein DFR59_107120 [Falsibacillus pallidus]